ncbi:MAG: hypothetical protein HYT79_10525 [Elusimicrobia bacterium]|nr:hypothetical protein [Elusimicrobiota bacterium]
MNKEIQELTWRIEELLGENQAVEVMHLKLKLEVAASRLFLALGWMLSESRVELLPSDYGYQVRRITQPATVGDS